MPEAHTYGAGGGKTCSKETAASAILVGQTPIQKSPRYDSKTAPAVLNTVPINTVNVTTFWIFVAIIDDGDGAYDLLVDGNSATMFNDDSDGLDGSYLETCRAYYVTGVPAGAHTVELDLIIGNNIKVFSTYVKVVATYCL
jgi:hypothetical protein